MDSAFNPELFEQTVITEANQVNMITVPEGDYEAYIEGYEFRAVPLPGGVRHTCEITWIIPNEELAKELNLQELKIRQTLWLDLSEDMTQLDFGTNRNIGLGRLRQALGLNEPGKPFQFSDLVAAAALISVKQTANKEDPSIIYSNVAKVVEKPS